MSREKKLVQNRDNTILKLKAHKADLESQLACIDGVYESIMNKDDVPCVVSHAFDTIQGYLNLCISSHNETIKIVVKTLFENDDD
jgi:hypothetical protein|tara:strand:+ start:180 stop:434 length:255 start_codon:yes stop_codon:yes gene_type:complete